MIRLTRSQVQPIGLDIGSDSVKMLQLETVGSTLSVLAAARQPLVMDGGQDSASRIAAAADVIRQMLRQGQFRGRRVVAALPREMLQVKNLRLPLIPPNELASAVKFEARNILPFEAETAHIQIIPAGEVRQGLDVKQEVIVLAAAQEDVERFLEQIHDSGAVVESLDVEACGLYRAFERFIRRREDEQEVHVIVDVGLARSQVVIGKGREISFLKSIELGSEHLHEAVSNKLAITRSEARALRLRQIESAGFPSPRPGADLNASNAEALANAQRDPVRQAVFDATRSTLEALGKEIALCLRYYSVTFRGQRPTKVRLCGGESADPFLIGVLNAALGVPVEPARPLYSVDTSRMQPDDRRSTMGEWALALGLGLKLTKGHFGPRDGKPRDPSAPWTAAPGPAFVSAEVVDINEAVSASREGAARPEEAHA
jgi:type IV pilus assembly protein PilM